MTPPVSAGLKLTQNLRSKNNAKSNHLCHVCGKAYKTQAGLSQHGITHAKLCHKTVKSNQCLKQRQGNANKISTKQHPVNANKLTCPKCKQHFACRELHQKHLKCCSTKFPRNLRKKQLASEKDVKGQQKRRKECDESATGQQKEKKSNSRRNLRSLIDGQKCDLLCETCGNSFSNVKGLQCHSKTHTVTPTKMKEYKCDRCNKVFRTPSCLKLHDINHHGAKSSLTCKMCEKHFLNNSRLMEHVRIVHTGEKIFTCPRCQKGFTCSRYLKRHLLEPSCSPKEKYNCHECNKLCKSKYSLMYHINTFHGNKPFRCKYCDRRYATEEHWQKHEAAHNGIYGAIPKKKAVRKLSLDFMCEQCGQAYGNKHLLARHQLLHSGEKPHICPTCSKSFRCKSTLTEHERIHSGEKPFFCEHCATRFRLSGHLRYHLKALHKVKDIGRLKKIKHESGECNHVESDGSKLESKNKIRNDQEKCGIATENKKQSVTEIASEIRNGEDGPMLESSMACDKIDNLHPLVPPGDLPDGGKTEELLNMLIQGSWLHGGGGDAQDRTREDPFRDQFLANQYSSQYMQPTPAYDGRTVGDKSYAYPDQGSDRSNVFGNVSFSQQFPGHSLQQMLFDPPQSKLNPYSCGGHQIKSTYETDNMQQMPYNSPAQGQVLNYEMVSQRQEQFPSSLTSELPATSEEKTHEGHQGQGLGFETTLSQNHVTSLMSELPATSEGKAHEGHQGEGLGLRTTLRQTHAIFPSELPSTSGDKDVDQQDHQGQAEYGNLHRQDTSFTSGLTSTSAEKGLAYQSVNYRTPHMEEQTHFSHVMTSELGCTSGHTDVSLQGQGTNYGSVKNQDQTFYPSIITPEIPPSSGDKHYQESIYEMQKRSDQSSLANIVVFEFLPIHKDKNVENYLPQYKELKTRTGCQSNSTPPYDAGIITGTTSHGSTVDEMLRSKIKGRDDILRSNATQETIHSSTEMMIASNVQRNIPSEHVHKQDPNGSAPNVMNFGIHHSNVSKDLQNTSNDLGKDADGIHGLMQNETKGCDNIRNLYINDLISEQTATNIIDSASNSERKISDLIQCLENSHESDDQNGRIIDSNSGNTPTSTRALIEPILGTKKFCCTVCNVLFKSEDDLNVHSQIHVQEPALGTVRIGCTSEDDLNAQSQIHVQTRQSERLREVNSKSESDSVHAGTSKDFAGVTTCDEGVKQDLKQLEPVGLCDKGLKQYLKDLEPGSDSICAGTSKEFADAATCDEGVKQDLKQLEPVGLCDKGVKQYLKDLDPGSDSICAATSKEVADAATRDEGVEQDLRHLCEVCGKSYQTKSNLRHHKKTHSRQRYQCLHCQQNFNSRRSMHMHNINRHDGKSPYKCTRCDKGFLYVAKLDEHVRIQHTHETPFSCHKCNKTFTCRRNLRRHLNEPTCSPKQRFPCDQCSKSCKSQYSLNYHKSLHHTKKPYQCELCGKGYATKENCKRHEENHGDLRKLAKKPKPTSKDFVCDLCNKAYSNKHFLARHKQTHIGHKPFKCNVCDKAFLYNSALKEHLRTHSGEKPYICQHCGVAFRLSGHLRYHLKAVHDGDKQYSCSVCKKSFVYESTMLHHIKTHNEKQTNSAAKKRSGAVGGKNHKKKIKQVPNKIMLDNAQSETIVAQSGRKAMPVDLPETNFARNLSVAISADDDQSKAMLKSNPASLAATAELTSTAGVSSAHHQSSSTTAAELTSIAGVSSAHQPSAVTAELTSTAGVSSAHHQSSSTAAAVLENLKNVGLLNNRDSTCLSTSKLVTHHQSTCRTSQNQDLAFRNPIPMLPAPVGFLPPSHTHSSSLLAALATHAGSLLSHPSFTAHHRDNVSQPGLVTHLPFPISVGSMTQVISQSAAGPSVANELTPMTAAGVIPMQRPRLSASLATGNVQSFMTYSPIVPCTTS